MRLLKLAAAFVLATLPALSDVQAQTGPNPAELVFTTIAPCRAFLTSGVLAANQTRTFSVSGHAAAFTAQGGPAAGCGIPASATAVALSLTAFATTGTGHLRAYAFGDPVPGTQALAFRSGATETAGAIVAVKDSKLNVRAYAAGARLAGDITGYYAPQIGANVASNGSFLSKTSRVVNSIRTSTGNYEITIDRNVNDCHAISQTVFSFNGFSTNSITDSKIYVSTYAIRTGDAVPFFIDTNFILTVSC